MTPGCRMAADGRCSKLETLPKSWYEASSKNTCLVSTRHGPRPALFSGFSHDPCCCTMCEYRYGALPKSAPSRSSAMQRAGVVRRHDRTRVGTQSVQDTYMTLSCVRMYKGQDQEQGQGQKTRVVRQWQSKQRLVAVGLRAATDGQWPGTTNKERQAG